MVQLLEAQDAQCGFVRVPLVKSLNSSMQTVIEQKSGTESSGVQATDSSIRASSLGILEVKGVDL